MIMGCKQLCVGNGQQQDLDTVGCETLTHPFLCDWLVGHQGHWCVTTGGTAHTHRDTSKEHFVQCWTHPARHVVHDTQLD